MIISEKQIMLLMSILYDTIRIDVVQGLFGISDENRIKLYNQILLQQSEELKEIE